MGAIARQVVQVKRKNSTSCSPPDASETVAGSVASRFGPREVAMGRGVGITVSVGASVLCAEIIAVGLGGRTSTPGPAAVDPADTVGAVGEQAAKKTATQTRLGKKRIFAICLFNFINNSPFGAQNSYLLNKRSLSSQERTVIFDCIKILRYTSTGTWCNRKVKSAEYNKSSGTRFESLVT
jgi:hypothetical protein